jgi:hypothetical protein
VSLTRWKGVALWIKTRIILEKQGMWAYFMCVRMIMSYRHNEVVYTRSRLCLPWSSHNTHTVSKINHSIVTSHAVNAWQDMNLSSACGCSVTSSSVHLSSIGAACRRLSHPFSCIWFRSFFMQRILFLHSAFANKVHLRELVDFGK